MKNNNLLPLKSKDAFKSLFKEGEFYKEKNICVRYHKGKEDVFNVGYTVSKKLFSRAVDRNLIKRRIRSEVYNLSLLFVDKCVPGFYLFFYVGKHIPTSSDLSSNLLNLINKINKET